MFDPNDGVRCKFLDVFGDDVPVSGFYKPSATEVAVAIGGVKVAGWGTGSGASAPSPRCIATGGAAPMAAADGTDATPVVTETYIVEVMVPMPMLITGVALFNGSVAAGNIRLALYNKAGTSRLALSASTLMVGTDDYQRIPFAAAYQAAPGTYYVAVQYDDITARYNTHTIGNFGASKATGTVYGTLPTTITPPTTFTTALGPMGGLY
jgi:hypothetical protein